MDRQCAPQPIGFALRRPDSSLLDGPTRSTIEWLCKAFGFEQHLVVPGDDGTLTHAQLTFGNSMIMLGSMRDDEHGRLIEGRLWNFGSYDPWA